MRCRRCNSTHLVGLAKGNYRDNDIFRCQDCGFLFSPVSEQPGGQVSPVNPQAVTPPQVGTPPQPAPRAAAVPPRTRGKG